MPSQWHTTNSANTKNVPPASGTDHTICLIDESTNLSFLTPVRFTILWCCNNMTHRDSENTPTKLDLVILTVYAAEPRFFDLLEIQARFVASTCTGIRYKVLAIPLRLPTKEQHAIQDLIPVQWVKPKVHEFVDKWEHGFLLDQLLAIALQQSPSWICILDPDAFPIRSNWFSSLTASLQGQRGIASILRKENGDIFLPHPSFLLFEASTAEEVSFSFKPSKIPIRRIHLPYSQQFADVGVRIGARVATGQLSWLALVLSNRRNDHFLFAGVYGDSIFHLGSICKPLRIYRGDRKRSLLLRLHYYVRRKLSFIGHRAIMLNVAEVASLFARRRAISRNQVVHEVIVSRLRRGAEQYIESLLTTSRENGSKLGGGVYWYS